MSSDLRASDLHAIDAALAALAPSPAQIEGAHAYARSLASRVPNVDAFLDALADGSYVSRPPMAAAAGALDSDTTGQFDLADAYAGDPSFGAGDDESLARDTTDVIDPPPTKLDPAKKRLSSKPPEDDDEEAFFKRILR